jgi:2-methylcitrate dehydratase PrpD
MTLTATLASYAAKSSIVDIPAVVRDRARKVIFDEMACGYFGRRSPAGRMAATYAARYRGKKESLVLGTGAWLPAPFAALANGTSGHGEEVDGAHTVGGHPGASIVHAAVAMAERQRASGDELINAVVLGYDVGTRFVQACGGKFAVRDRLHLTSDFLYAFGAAAAATRLLGLDAPRHAHALALASFQTNGLYALYSEKRHISKSFCNGQYAFAGVSAALLSGDGLEGNDDIIGSKQGLLNAWGTEGGGEIIISDLGGRFAIMDANFKFLNAGYPIHTAAEAAMTLVLENQLKITSINEIRIGMPENAMRVVDNRKMHNICVQDIVAASIVTGGLRLGDLPFPSILSDPRFHDIRARIAVTVDEDLQREAPDGRGSRVTIVTTNGAELSLRIDHPKGHCRRGDVSWSELRNKWEGALPGCDLDEALQLGQSLQTLSDVRELTLAFCGIMP